MQRIAAFFLMTTDEVPETTCMSEQQKGALLKNMKKEVKARCKSRSARVFEDLDRGPFGVLR